MPIRITGLNSGLDTDSIVQELVSAYKTKQESYEKKQTKVSWTQDAWKEMNTKIYGFYSKSLSNMRFVGNYTSKKTTTLSDPTKASIVASSSVMNGTQTLKVNQLAKAGYLTGKELSKVKDSNGEDVAVSNSTTLGDLGIKSDTTLTLKVGEDTKTFDVTGDMTVSSFVSKLKEQGINASFDTTQQRFFLSSSATGEENDFEFVVGENDAAYQALDSLGLATAKNYMSYNAVANEESLTDKQKKEIAELADQVKASDAKITLNGAEFTSSSNKFSINGLTITAMGVSEEMTFTTDTDVDGIYNMIKDFFSEYNTLMNSMEAAYNADSASGYEPLTDDEKSEMSDEEIEKWEKKIKDSLLRRDDTLSSVLSAMSTAMQKTYTINGKTYSLSSFGISTAGYFNKAENESYAFHIDGDEDDATSQGNTDKLKAAIAEDPDAVAEFFSQLTTNVYSVLSKKMEKTSLSSAMTIYNDKQLQQDYDDYQDMIDKWEEKLEYMEEYYYNKFSAMETALSKLQSQTNSLTSLLGG